MSENKYPLKHMRLQQLEEAGFNTADFIFFPPNRADLGRVRKFFKKHGRISIRHYGEDENRFFKCPVLYNQEDWSVIWQFINQNNKRFWTLCNQAIRLEDSQFAGNILLLDEKGRNFTVEYFEGPGTPRDMEHKSPSQLKCFRREFGKPFLGSIHQELISVAAQFRNFLPEQRPIVLEFSIYPYPIGKLQRHDIFWEWRLG